ncbi:MAG TPA: hypothetical protein VFZ38_17150, partial [Vicinamibacterales bacterium]
MTLYAWAKRRVLTSLPAAEPRYFDVAADARVLAHCNWQPGAPATRSVRGGVEAGAPATRSVRGGVEPGRRQAPTLLILHGLEGSSEAHYMRGLA